jgi:hypothetical protein
MRNKFTQERRKLRVTRSLKKHALARRERLAKGCYLGKPILLPVLCRWLIFAETDEERACLMCHKMFSRTELKVRDAGGKTRPLCKTCWNQRNREWKKINPDRWAVFQQRAKAGELKRLYGLSLQDYENLKDSQNGLCAICFEKPKRWHLDHCHSTGAVRGLLCQPCNHALGLFKDSPERIRRAASYLESQNR